MIESKEFPLKLEDGSEKTYILHKFSCIEGREILTQYPVTGMPKLGSYEENQKLMFRVLAKVSIRLSDDSELYLSNRSLIENHIPDAETLLKIEFEMFKYNFNFFCSGDVFEVLKILTAQLLNNTQTSTDLSEQSSLVDRPH